MAAPISLGELERQIALEDYDILDADPDAKLDDIVKLAAEVCHAPTSMITMIDRDHQFVKAVNGPRPADVSRELAFSAHAITSTSLYMVSDTQQDDRFLANPFNLGDDALRFYAAAPIVTPEGYVLGTLCVIDQVPRTLDEAQQRSMLVLAESIGAYLELRRMRRLLRHTTMAMQPLTRPN